MKKIFLLLASVALLLVGCAKEQMANGVDGGMTEVTFTTNLESSVATRAAADGDGFAASINRCIMEIYYGDELFTRQYAKVTGKQATFTAQVVSNRTYTVAFWADHVANPTTEEGLEADMYYTTDAEGGLKAIAIKDTDPNLYIGNNDARDAFFACCDDCKVEQNGTAFTATLKRPFAQVNVITTDWNKVAAVEALKPEKVKVTLKNAMNAFNAVEGVASGSQTLTYDAAVYTAPAPVSPVSATEKTLSMDYLFASTEKATIDIDWKALHGADDAVEYAFATIPYQRNYRTNIKGALLTAQGQWAVTVDSDWDGDGTDEESDPHLVNWYEVGSIAAANEALKTKNAVSIENPSDLGTNIVIPAEQDAKNVYITVTGASEGNIVVKQEGEGPANLNIESDSKTLDINLPNSHVEVNGGTYTDVTAKTGDNTLVVGKDVTVQNLDVKKGNVEIHGIVNGLTRVNGVKAEMYASDRATLINYINWAKAGDTVGLECDIDLAGENWTPLRKGNDRFNATFDGQGHTISNMTISLDWANGVGFFSDMSGVAKNFTIDKATIANTTADKGNMYGIVAGYAYGNVTFENITVKNSKIHAFGKVGGILGMAADPNGTTVVKNCKVEDTMIIGAYNVANYVGLVQNAINLEECTSTNVKKELGGRYGEDAYVTFDNVKVINNDEQNPKYVLSNGKYWKYEGSYYAALADCYNDMKNYGEWKALDGTVDALVFNTPDTPELKDLEPVATIGDVKYYDLPKALAALQQGETLEIHQAGEYTVQTLSAPANSIIDAKVEGVVFNRTPGNSITSYGTDTPATVKNLTWNLGSANYQYFNCKVENCTINGRPSIHTFASFKDCKLINTYAEDYCITTYGSPCTFENCKFSSQGKFVNVYGETQSSSKEVTATNCEFENLKSSVYKAAFNIKGNGDGQKQHTHVVIENCTTKGMFPDHTTTDGNAIFFDGGLIMFDDPAWEDDVYAVVDGVTYYPYFTIDANGNYSVNNATGLHKAIEHYNALTIACERTISVADGTYEVSDLLVKQNVKNKSVKIMAANKHQVVMKINADSKTHIFFLIDGGNNKEYPEYVTIDGFDFQVPTNPGQSSTDETFIVYGLGSGDEIGKKLNSDYVSKYYAHNVTLSNCKVLGFNTQYISVMKCPNKASNKNAIVDNCIIDKVGYVVNGYFDQAFVKNSTVTNSKVLANINTFGISVENCNVSTYHDYCIRTNGGPVVVKNNIFNITWNDTTTDVPAVVYLKTNNNSVVATITGNTFAKASTSMYDLYCAHEWKVNDETKEARTKLNF